MSFGFPWWLVMSLTQHFFVPRNGCLINTKSTVDEAVIYTSIKILVAFPPLEKRLIKWYFGADKPRESLSMYHMSRSRQRWRRMRWL